MQKKILILIFFVSSFLVTTKVYAQETTNGIDVTISPTSFDLKNLPGSTIQSKFRIRNNTDAAIPFTISIGKLLPNGNYNNVTPADVTSQDVFSHWIHFYEASISARPKEWTQVNFTINIPPTAAFGYYYAIRIKQVSSTTQHTSGSKVLGEVLIPIILEVKKDGALAQGRIVNFAPTTMINQYMPVSFTTEVENTGNVHINPRGNIFIQTGTDQNAAILDVNDAQGSILPGGKRVFTSSWDDGFLAMEPVMEDGVVKLDKNNKPVTHLVVNWNLLTHFRIGKYTAHLLMVYDNGTNDVSMESSTTFWIIPYTMIGIATAGLIIIVLIVRFLFKLYIRRELKKMKS